MFVEFLFLGMDTRKECSSWFCLLLLRPRRDENEGIRGRAIKSFAKGVGGMYYSTVVEVSYTELVR